MAPVQVEGIEGLKALQGETIGPSDWREVTQRDIDTFADLTGDHQWIHTDVERAKKESPFGTTVAHGNLTLSLIDGLRIELLRSTGFKLGVNYGWNKVRFPAPVPSGARIRATAEVVEIDDVGGGWWQIVTRFTVEVEGNDKPACVADSVGRALSGVSRRPRVPGDGADSRGWRRISSATCAPRVSMRFRDRTRAPCDGSRYLTVSVPCIPASRWPGTVQ